MCAVPNMAVFIIIIIIIIIIICGGGGGGGGFSRSNSDDSGLLSSSVNLDWHRPLVYFLSINCLLNDQTQPYISSILVFRYTLQHVSAVHMSHRHLVH